MSLTTRQCRTALHAIVKGLFLGGNVPSEFNCPIAQENIIGYFTQPLETGDSPNWIIVYTIHSTTRGFVVGGTEQPARLGVLMACRLSKDDGAEVSREAAENWLDDAEEYLLRELSNNKTDDWHGLRATAPRRDGNRQYFGRFRISNIAFDVEKR